MLRSAKAAVVAAAVLATVTTASPAGAITGGREAFDGDRSLVPAVVRIDASGPTNYCSGTLIAPQWALTAQHCTYRHENAGTPYAAGSLTVKVNKSAAGDGRTVKAVEIFRMDGFTDQLVNDVALLKLESPISDVTPIRIADGPVPRGANGYVYGFGPTHRGGFGEWVKRNATFSGANEPTKMPRLAELKVAEPACGLPAKLTYVTSVRGRSVDGDSGGPLLEWDNGTPTLYNVTAGNVNRSCREADEQKADGWIGLLNPVDRQSDAWKSFITRHVPGM